MASNNQVKTRFGVEIETRIQGLEEHTDASKAGLTGYARDQWEFERWAKTMAPLSNALTSTGVANNVTGDQYEKGDYTKWNITQDMSITLPEGSSTSTQRGVELVSPILDYPDRQCWHNQLSRVYNVLRRAPFHASPDKTCALHVHVSITPAWDTEHVRRLALAIAHFTPHLARLAAGVGRRRPTEASPDDKEDYAGPNHVDAETPARLRACTTIAELAETLCPKDRPKKEKTAVGGSPENAPPSPRHFYWSLWPLVGLGFEDNEHGFCIPKTGTVEFRLPPSPAAAAGWEDAAAWVDFANLFVLAAVDKDVESEGEDLCAFVISKGCRAGVPRADLERLERLLSVLV